MPLPPRARRFLPWLAGTLALALLLWAVPIRETLAAIDNARLELLLPLVGFACLGWFLIDSAALAFLFTRFNAPLSQTDARALRGLTYLLTPIHWNIGRAAIIARFHRSHRVGILEATSSLALYQTLDAILLSALSWMGLSQLPSTPTTSTLSLLVASVGVAATGYLVLIRFPALPFPLLAPLLDRIRASTFHQAHRRVCLRDVWTLLLFRLAYYGLFVAVYYWGAVAFGFELPLFLVIASVPIIQAIGAIPISPAGFGTQQAAMLYLFAAQGEAASILAFGLSFPLLCIVFRSLIGWPYLIGMTRAKPADGSLATQTRRMKGDPA